MQSQGYKESIELALRHIQLAELNLFKAMLNVSINGIYKDIIKRDDEETYEVELGMFEDTEDFNVNVISNLVKHLKDAASFIAEANSLNLDIPQA